MDDNLNLEKESRKWGKKNILKNKIIIMIIMVKKILDQREARVAIRQPVIIFLMVF